MTRFRPLLCLIALLAALPAAAQPIPDAGPGWGPDRWRTGRGSDARDARTPAEPARDIVVDTFRATDAAPLLGKGRIVVAAASGAEAEWKLPVYEAAVVDELGRRGYDTATASDPAQIAQIAISHQTVVPAEAPHKPVSGVMSTTVSNRGSAFGMALALDFTKPRKAIVATRLDVRIRDKASGRVLWEGHAEGQTREGDEGLDNGAVAARLASALFARFPDGQPVPPPDPAGAPPEG